ncbi:hypothetical protein [Rubellimicrobium roseum]|uniref:hypothetical protein n=1 Tax=Rubellimicrobium roseum TaxID=687525 RepID=UPI001C3F41A9|nr:hypothetical protein [Rubellimicrobium roseum]
MPRLLVVLVMLIAIALAGWFVLFSPGWIERTASDRVEINEQVLKRNHPDALHAFAQRS